MNLMWTPVDLQTPWKCATKSRHPSPVNVFPERLRAPLPRRYLQYLPNYVPLFSFILPLPVSEPPDAYQFANRELSPGHWLDDPSLGQGLMQPLNTLQPILRHAAMPEEQLQQSAQQPPEQ